ncbi:MAG TPA: antibiotic biosynthesis monooxygenase [Dehalococcoidia bacterium]|nr:antibiotic biosynthesis monooxygenase [Dehalococcoidia bacterium]
MYLHLELKTMATDRLQEAVARLHYLHSLMAKSPGFAEAQICEFLGNPGQYLVVRTWTEGAAHAAYRQSQAAKEFAASRPAGFIYDNLAVQEWQCVLEARGGAAGDYVVRRLLSIDSGGWPPLLAEREQENAAQLKAGGVNAVRTYRMLPGEKADDTQVLTLDRWAGRESYSNYLATVPVPGSGLTECYQVVDEVLPH